MPGNLQRRMLKIGDKEREFFIHIPESVKGRPAPVVFALRGGASSSGLAMHFKADYTKLGDKEGYATVYPSGVNGWPMQRGRDETGTGPKTRDISAPEELWAFLKEHHL